MTVFFAFKIRNKSCIYLKDLINKLIKVFLSLLLITIKLNDIYYLKSTLFNLIFIFFF